MGLGRAIGSVIGELRYGGAPGVLKEEVAAAFRRGGIAHTSYAYLKDLPKADLATTHAAVKDIDELKLKAADGTTHLITHAAFKADLTRELSTPRGKYQGFEKHFTDRVTALRGVIEKWTDMKQHLPPGTPQPTALQIEQQVRALKEQGVVAMGEQLQGQLQAIDDYFAHPHAPPHPLAAMPQKDKDALRDSIKTKLTSEHGAKVTDFKKEMDEKLKKFHEVERKGADGKTETYDPSKEAAEKEMQKVNFILHIQRDEEFQKFLEAAKQKHRGALVVGNPTEPELDEYAVYQDYLKQPGKAEFRTPSGKAIATEQGFSLQYSFASFRTSDDGVMAKDLDALFAAAKASGKENPTITITCSDDEQEKSRLVRLAVEAALRQGYKMENLTVTVNGAPVKQPEEHGVDISGSKAVYEEKVKLMKGAMADVRAAHSSAADLDRVFAPLEVAAAAVVKP